MFLSPLRTKTGPPVGTRDEIRRTAPFALTAGAYFAWAWSLLVYAPVLITLSVTRQAPPLLFQLPLLCALIVTLLLWPYLRDHVQRLGRRPQDPASGETTTRPALNPDIVIPAAGAGAAAVAATATAALAFTPPGWWAFLGLLSGSAAGLALAGAGPTWARLEPERIPVAAGWAMVVAAVLHLPVAVLARFAPPEALAVFTGLAALLWALPHLAKLRAGQLASEPPTAHPVSPPPDEPDGWHARRWLALAGAIVFIFLASDRVFMGIQEYAGLPPATWGADEMVGYLVHDGRLYLSQDIIGLTGTLVYALAAVLIGYLATLIDPGRLLFRAILIAGLAVACFALLESLAGAVGSFLLLQVSLAFVDVFFWIALLVLAMRRPHHAAYVTGAALALYAVAGFLPPVLLPPGGAALPHAFLAAALFLFAAIALTDVITDRALLPELDLRRLWGDTETPGADDRDAVVAHNWAAFPAERLNESLGRYRLTPREQEIALLVMQGLSSAEIAERCHISKNTLKTHMRNLLRKTGQSNAKEFILWVVKNTSG